MMLPEIREGMEALVALPAEDPGDGVPPRSLPDPLSQPLTMSVRQPVSLQHRPVMGTHATDVNGQVLLQLATEKPDEVRGWLPGGELFSDLMALLHVWLGSHLDVRLQLCVARHLLPDAQLCCQQGIVRSAVPLCCVRWMRRNRLTTESRFIWGAISASENIHRRESDEDGDYRS